MELPRKEREFSPDVRQVMRSSGREARRLRHGRIDVDHLLLAIIAEPECGAAELLQKLGCDLDQLRHAVEHAIQLSETVVPETAHLPLTKEAEKVLRKAYDEADKTGREVIGTEHILLSLLHDRETAAARAMEQACGITYEQVRAAAEPQA